MADFVKVAALSELPRGQKRVVAYDDEEVGLINLDGTIYAVANICTHDDGPLLNGQIDGKHIVCPRHGARFNLETGAPTFPAFSPLPRFNVKLDGDDILIAPLD